jgi:hypothetical protein
LHPIAQTPGRETAGGGDDRPETERGLLDRNAGDVGKHHVATIPYRQRLRKRILAFRHNLLINISF